MKVFKSRFVQIFSLVFGLFIQFACSVSPVTADETNPLSAARALTAQEPFRVRATQIYYRRWLGRSANANETTEFTQPWSRSPSGWQTSLANLLCSDAYYQNSGNILVGYIQHLYGDVLGRPPHQQELKNTSDFLIQGKSRFTLVSSLISSPDGLKHTARFWFVTLVKRVPTGAELSPLCQALKAEGIDGLAATIVASPAYMAADAEMVWNRRIETDLNEAAPEAPSLIPINQTRLPMVQSLVQSPGFRVASLQQMYGRYLDRGATQEEIDKWFALIKTGTTLEQIRVSLLTSDEYFQRAGGNFPAYIKQLEKDLTSPSITAAAPTGEKDRSG